MRLPLQTTAEFRSIDDSKDAITVNGFVEVESDTERYVHKRPGILLEVSGAGVANGAFVYGDSLYSWDITTGALTPNITGFWNSGTSYTGGSTTPVLYEGGPWYPIDPLVGVPPSEPRWSTSIPVGEGFNHSFSFDIENTNDFIADITTSPENFGVEGTYVRVQSDGNIPEGTYILHLEMSIFDSEATEYSDFTDIEADFIGSNTAVVIYEGGIYNLYINDVVQLSVSVPEEVTTIDTRELIVTNVNPSIGFIYDEVFL